jgi:geranylgeranyl diphosphate synthase type II
MSSSDAAALAFDVRTHMDTVRPQIDAALERVLPPATAVPANLHGAMRHSVFAGGKRLRPLLALAGCGAGGATPETAMPVACAIELIHTYSLIHDDLPAFDDEELRRGQPTCHVVYGEAVAILAGDALQALAFEVLGQAGLAASAPRAWTAAAREMARAAGSVGMCGGQTLDIEAAGAALDIDGLRTLHAHKTGALLTAAVVCGGMVGDADETQLQALRVYGDAVGLAFQIVDDVLDVEGTAEELGKNPGGDAARDQPTFPALIGLDASRVEATRLLDAARDALDDFETARSAPLRGLAEYIISRSR